MFHVYLFFRYPMCVAFIQHQSLGCFIKDRCDDITVDADITIHVEKQGIVFINTDLILV